MISAALLMIQTHAHGHILAFILDRYLSTVAMPRDSESSVTALTPSTLIFRTTTPHWQSEQDGMEGSATAFVRGVVVTPMIRPTRGGFSLVEIRWMNRKKCCADCNRGTHLSWISGEIRYWICRGCGQRRGGIYRRALKQFRDPS